MHARETAQLLVGEDCNREDTLQVITDQKVSEERAAHLESTHATRLTSDELLNLYAVTGISVYGEEALTRMLIEELTGSKNDD